jgi:hypothetical protein
MGDGIDENWKGKLTFIKSNLGLLVPVYTLYNLLGRKRQMKRNKKK